MAAIWAPSSIGAWLSQPVGPGGAGGRRTLPSFVARPFVRAYLATLPEPAPGDGRDLLDVFVRIGPRDLDVAPIALASLRRHLVNQIRTVSVSTPSACVEAVGQACDDVEIVADEDLLPPAIREAIVQAVMPSRVSWVRQQFLTLVHTSTRARNACLVWDADSVMVRPQTLVRGHTAALAISSEHHKPYFRVIRTLFPDLPLPVQTSTVAHHMVMHPELLCELFREIETRAPGRPWWRTMLDLIDPREASPISDYELYGQWVRQRHPDRVRLVGFRNIGLSRGRFFAESLEPWAHRAIDSISTHWWIPEPRR